MKEESGYREETWCSSSCVGKKRSKSRSIMEEGKRSEAPRPCTECGKKFWSWKALFGHMRCHPERHWRGINPPPNARRQPQKHMMMTMTHEDHEVAACLLMLANSNNNNNNNNEKEEDVHQCSSCNKVFGSHQALGGHRASHKNVKGCFANANNSDFDGHKCSICLRVFSTGQALGGHKRCHWDKGGDFNMNLLVDSSANSVDLNFPPPTDHSSSPHLDPDPPLTLDLRLGL